MSRDTEIGKHIAALREQANLKQNELAKKAGMERGSFRVESGERPLAEGELEIILHGIGTPEAMKVKEILNRQWQILPEPPLGDPDADLLLEAEQAAKAVHALAEGPDVNNTLRGDWFVTRKNCPARRAE